MKNFSTTILLLLILGGTAYYFRSYIFPTAPCSEPIPYHLGTFSNEFNLTQKYFLEALAQAEAIWEKSINHDLFVYAPSDTSSDALKINLIYDYRQEATKKLAGLGIVVENTRASYDSLKAKFLTLRTTFEKEQAQFEARLASWNRSSRTNKSEFDSLQAEQRDLKRKADEINSLVFVLNRLAQVLNLSVEKYNDINVARGESFEEGVYSSDGREREIDIYEFSSKTKLVRVLAHELGHALSLGHVADPKAMMYELNQNTMLTLSPADITALQAVCGLK